MNAKIDLQILSKSASVHCAHQFVCRPVLRSSLHKHKNVFKSILGETVELQSLATHDILTPIFLLLNLLVLLSAPICTQLSTMVANKE